MIKRTRSMADKVRKALSEIRSEYLLCRTRRRHDYKKPVMRVPVMAGKHSAVLDLTCRECGTVRRDTWRVSVNKDLILTIPEDGFVSRAYVHPEGYSLDGELDITPMEFQETFMDRLFQELVKAVN